MLKYSFSALVILTSSFVFTLARAQDTVGDGIDQHEIQRGTPNFGAMADRKINLVRGLLLDWLERKGYRHLNLGVSPKEYAQRMKTALQDVPKINLTNDRYESSSGNHSCLSYSEGLKSIECNQKDIEQAGIPTLIWMLHHEYAAVAGLEVNLNTERSDYSISDQIPNFVTWRGGWKLRTRPYRNVRYAFGTPGSAYVHPEDASEVLDKIGAERMARGVIYDHYFSSCYQELNIETQQLSKLSPLQRGLVLDCVEKKLLKDKR